MRREQNEESLTNPPLEYAEVAIPVPLRQTFTYRIPETLLGKVVPGSRVAVSFQRRKVAGIVTRLAGQAPKGVRLVSIFGLIEEAPLFPEELLSLLIDASRYYFHPIGEVLRAAAPALPTGALSRLKRGGFFEEGQSIKGAQVSESREVFVSRTSMPLESVRLGDKQRALLTRIESAREIDLSSLRQFDKRARQIVRALESKSLVQTEERVVKNALFRTPIERDTPPVLTSAQTHATDAIRTALRGSDPAQFLLHGVTGSGKTEVYLHAIETCREFGHGALLLVPEIALTPQLVGRFRARFGDDIAVLHSALKPKERDEAWRQLRRGDVTLAIGARSALFAPVPNLRLVIVDEEHDGSFKQEDGFRYHGRDMAVLRAHRAGAVCVLGSATPSMETFFRATKTSDKDARQMTLLSLPERARGQAMPSVELIDLRRHKTRPNRPRLISGALENALEECLEAGDQAILFLNRRGFSPALRCFSCGELAECPSCSVSLTVHRSARHARLHCHYCDFQRPLFERCPSCGSTDLGHLGLGTEQLERTIAEMYPDKTVARLDRDVAGGGGSEAVIKRLRDREVDVLVGTQMVTKGHDLPGVTLVGVLSADQSLAFPDFRAEERTFQLLAQVAGRAGRGEKPGRVLFQSFQPDHPSVALAASHDYLSFFDRELRDRRDLSYPPFGHVVALRVNAVNASDARRAIDALTEVARGHEATTSLRVMVQGPTEAPIFKVRNRYRFRTLFRSEDRRALRAVTARVAAAIDKGVARGTRASVDVDPVSML